MLWRTACSCLIRSLCPASARNVLSPTPLPCPTQHCSLHARCPSQSRTLLSYNRPLFPESNRERESPSSHTSCRAQKLPSFLPTPTHGPQTGCLGTSTSTLFPKGFLCLFSSLTSGGLALLASKVAGTCLRPTENTA